jgi:hypothetical protein
MKAVFGVLLAALAVGIAYAIAHSATADGSQSMSFSNLTSADFYKKPGAGTVGSALAAHGAYGWYTRGLLLERSKQLNLGPLTRHSLAASRWNYLGKGALGLYLLGLNRYYTSNQPYYLNKK